MMTSLLPALLLSAHLLPVDGARTFIGTDRTTGKRLECDRCPPGFYLLARCTQTRRSECAPCPPGSFTALWNHIGVCLRCSVCGQNQVVKTECSAESDCECQCKQGFHYVKKYGVCVQHSECPSGHGVVSKGTSAEDTTCQVCPSGTFSDMVSADQHCLRHRRCNGTGLQLVLKGSAWHDSVCTSCHSQRSEAADYLREILPAFFLHHPMSVRQLRLLVQKLPLDDIKKPAAAVSRLGPSALRSRIDAWAVAAADQQLRRLPAMLTKMGATSAGQRLQRKLQLIDSRLNEQSFLEHHKDAVVTATAAVQI